MRRKNHVRSALLLVVFLFTLIPTFTPQATPPALAADSTAVVIDTGIDRFELYADRIFYWQNGSCGTRTIEGIIRRQMIEYPETRADVQEADCNVAPTTRPDVARDEFHLYYFSGQQLVRTLASGGNPWTLPGVAPVSSRAGLSLDTRDLYWSSYNASTDISTIWTMPISADEAPDAIAIADGEIVWLRNLTAHNGTSVEQMLVWRTFDGTLGRWKPTPLPYGSRITLGDSQFIDQSIAESGSPQHTFVYALNADALRRIDLFSGQDTLLYTPAAGWKLRAVAADGPKPAGQERQIFISEQPDGCVGTACLNNGRIKRHSLNASDWTPASWSIIADATTGGAGINLRSADNQLYFLKPGTPGTILQLDAGAAPVYSNLKALGIEVVQAIQSMAGDVKLVADRETYVRGYAVLSTGSSTSSALPNARLDRLAPDGATVLDSVWAINNPKITLNTPLADLRSEAARSFQFVLPMSWVNQPGNSFQLRLRMVVNPDGSVPENGGSLDDNSVSTPAPITFERRAPPCLVTRPVMAQGAPLPMYNSPLLVQAIARARSLLPVVSFQHIPLMVPLTDSGDPYVLGINMNGNVIETYGDDDALVDMAFFALKSDPIPGCAATFYAGIVHPDATWKWGGLGNTPGNTLLFKLRSDGATAYGTPLGGRTLAHELLHNFGAQHVQCGSGFDPDNAFDMNYPYPFCSISASADLNNSATHAGFDPLSYFSGKPEESVITPTEAADLMTYNGTRWVSPYQWNGVLNVPFFNNTATTLTPEEEIQRSTTPQLIIQGAIRRRTGLIARMEVLPPEATPLRNPTQPGTQRHDYRLAILGARNELLAEHALTLADTGGHGDHGRQSFLALLDWPAGAARVELRHGNLVLDTRRLSTASPTVNLHTPEQNTAVGTIRLRWDAADPDGDRLLATVQYSTDGEHWQTLISDILDRELSLARIPGVTHVRVLIGDGARVAVSAPQPLISVNQPPMVVISGLEPGAHLEFGSSVQFFGSSYDPEDGALNTLEWQLNGPSSGTASGFEYAINQLLPGNYTIYLRTQDSDGLPGEDSISFTVLAPEVPTHPQPATFVLDGECTADEYFSGLEITLQGSSTSSPDMRMIRSNGTLLDALYVCIYNQDYADSNTIVHHAGLRFDPNFSGEAQAQPDDIGFLAREDGEIIELAGGIFGTMPPIPDPIYGFDARTRRYGYGWTAELRIPVNLLGGWDKPVGMMFSSNADDPQDDGQTWPATAGPTSPASWMRIHLGTVFTPLNTQPYAHPVEPQVEWPSERRTIYLDSSGGDPLGRALDYQWMQIGGPPVTLNNAGSATASFITDPVSVPTELRFEVRISVAGGASPPAVESSAATTASVRVVLLPPFSMADRIRLPEEVYLPAIVR